MMVLADVFDALISLRVYKAALSFEQARGAVELGARVCDRDIARDVARQDVSHGGTVVRLVGTLA